VVNADDFGLTPEVNDGILQGHVRGVVTSTSVMTNMPYFEAIRAAQSRHPELGVGLHVCLSEGKPVLPAGQIPTLVGAEGELLPRKILFERVRAGTVDLRHVLLEVRAQADRLLQLGVRIDHWNSHQDTHLNPKLQAAIMTALQPREFPCARTHRRVYVRQGGWIRGTNLVRFYGKMPMRAVKDLYFENESQRAARRGYITPDAQITRVPFHSEYSVLSANAPLDPPAGSYEWVCHPATERRPEDRPTMDRPGELTLLTAPDLKQALEQRGIRITNFTSALIHSAVSA
jgi:predicted glycoside hydrolase/deacetylase ChbG (UPF0249 family)